MKGMDGDKLFAKFRKLKSERALWENHWQECSDFCSPSQEDVTVKSSPGEKKAQRILDNTAMVEADTLAGMLHGFLTSSATKFFQLTTGNPKIDEKDAVRRWLDTTTNTLWRVLQSSNFQAESHEKFTNDVVFGTATMSIEEDEQLIVRFSSRPISEMYIDEDYRGFVNVHMRYYEESAANLVEQFGIKVVPEKVRDAYKNQSDKKFNVLHACYPKSMVPGNERVKAYSYISQYTLEDGKQDILVEGFKESPFVTDRWKKASGEKYGRSPGMNALPEAKMLNAMMYTTLSGAQKVVDPPLQAPDDGFVHPLITAPAGMNYYRAGSQDRIEPIFNDARVDFGIQLVELQQTKIKKAFFTDQLKLPPNTGQNNQMSATETIQRLEEAFRLMSPYNGRQEVEFLKPMISRVYAICERKGLIEDPPQEIDNKNIDVVFSSLIAMAQRQKISDDVLRGLQAMQPFYAVDQTAGDNIDTDAAVRRVGQVYFPADLLRDLDDVEAIRKQRAEMQKQQQKLIQEQANAETISKVAPAISKVQETQQAV